MTDIELDAVKQFRELITETQDENRETLARAKMFMENPEMFEMLKELLPKEMLEQIDVLEVFMKILTTVQMNYTIIDKLMTVIDTNDDVRRVIDIRLNQVL